MAISSFSSNCHVATFMALVVTSGGGLSLLPQSTNARCGVHRKSQGCCWNAAKLKSLTSSFQIKSFQQVSSGSTDADEFEVVSEDRTTVSDIPVASLESKNDFTNSFLSKAGIFLGVSAVVTLISVTLIVPNGGMSFGIQVISDGSSPSAVAATSGGFSFHAFGYTMVLPEYAPGWAYFWLLMAAGCGLFISEEALNIWVGITLARLLSLDGTWQNFSVSFSKNALYIVSTIIWVYWGVTLSDMIPFFLGKLFRRSGASADIVSKIGLSKEKAMEITSSIQKYGNLIGFVERFSIGARNPTAFLAGAMGISAECFFAGVCCGGLITLTLQLGAGFLLREHPLAAIATVGTVVGMWTAFPYAMAALTVIYMYVKRRYSSD